MLDRNTPMVRTYIRMDNGRVAKKKFGNESSGRRKVGSQRLRLMEDVEKHIRGMNIERIRQRGRMRQGMV